MSVRTPLARARGLGAAHGGTHHWWIQRATAVVMVPLILWFAFSLAALGAADHATASAWLAHPVNAVLALVLIAAMFHHLHLGLQVIIEDYIHSRWVKFAALILQKFFTIIFGFGAAFAVLKVALS